MVPRSRRYVLAGVAGLLAGASGCADEVGETTSTPTATERGYAHSEPSPSARTVRNAAGDPAVRSSVVAPLRGWDTEEWLVTTPGERDALAFVRGATGVDAARDLVAGVDLSARTLLVHQYRVEPHLTRRLDRLRWGAAASNVEASAVELAYTATERDVNEQSDDPAHVEATLAVVPDRIARLGRFTSEVDF